MRLSLVLFVLFGCAKKIETSNPARYVWEMNDDIILPEDEDLDDLPEEDNGVENEQDTSEEDQVEKNL